MSAHTTVLALSEALSIARKEIDPTVSTMQISIILYIAENPGKSVKEIANFFDIDTGNCSRLIAALGARNVRSSSKGNYQLVETPDDTEDLRRKAVVLSQKGRDFVQKLTQTLEKHLGSI